MKNCRIVSAACLALGLAGAPAPATWVEFTLPNLSQAFGATALGHLPDGRYLFAETGNLYLQDAWGSPAYTPFANEPAGCDPSFVAVRGLTLAALGYGGWTASPLYRFDPSDPSDPDFVDLGVTLQNYYGVFWDDESLLVGGADTGPEGNRHGLRYVRLDGTVNKVIVDDVSAYSCGFALDSAGNLYVGDNDDGCVYRFTSAQVQSAVSGSPLTVADGELVHDFGDGGNISSLAVDGLGRIWAAGWQSVGLRMFDPVPGEEFLFVPSLSNTNYRVATFTRQNVSYVAYVVQENPWQGGTAQYYGYAPASEVVIPEPPPLILAALGGGLTLLARKSHA